MIKTRIIVRAVNISWSQVAKAFLGALLSLFTLSWSEAGEKTHWALQPLREPVEPQIRRDHVNAIDGFIASRLSTDGLALSGLAEKAILIRRLSLDLLGLPPDPTEVEAFKNDSTPQAYERLVERMLASPRYGERWGRHWLDAVRYTESQGFEYDRLRDNAWHYRDYVIRSFNEDKPYDRFMKEQIAGDVMEPLTSEGIVATSLLVCGAWDEAGSKQANATQKAITREEEMEDMLSVVGQTFLGLTINCARCHAHKFDPISTEEYYSIKSVFDGVQHGERPMAGAGELKRREERIADLKQKISKARQTISQIEDDGRKTASNGSDVPKSAEGVASPVWFFNGTPASGQLHGGAHVTNGILVLPREGAFYQGEPLTFDTREKTLEAWVTLSDLGQGGGAAISIESDDGIVFDAIVYGERQPRKWTAGSSGFERTRDLEAPEETARPDELLHLAIVYFGDNSIAVYRNGSLYGARYRPGSPLQSFRAGRSRILLGKRHTGGGKPFLNGAVRFAALYDRALSEKEVMTAFRNKGWNVPHAELIANLSPERRAQRQAILAEIEKWKSALTAIEPIPVSYAGNRTQPKPTKVLRRGDVTSAGEIVRPAGLAAIANLNPDLGLSADAPEAQRRLKFAEWLAHPGNPLPARVMANRVWQLHFGQGLVATPNDFGLNGARPTHPELLDWLAWKFIESGWSVKTLHRLIVHSTTYRQKSTATLEGLAKDADTMLLWRFSPRRLEAEAVRDAMLMASGQLNLAMGGPGFRPFDVLKFPANAYMPVDKIGPEYNRRTVYRMNVNSGKEPMLDAFDCPDPSVKTPRRGVTTTPLQALSLMNNSFVQRQAERLASRSLRESNNDLGKAIEIAFRLTLGRSPSADEAPAMLQAATERSLTNVCWTLLNSTEFVYLR